MSEDGKDITLWNIDEKHFSLQFEKSSLSFYDKLRVCRSLFLGQRMEFVTRGRVRFKEKQDGVER